MKQLSEKAAWLKLAKLWEAATQPQPSVDVFVNGGWPVGCSGLCPALSFMEDAGEIDKGTRRSMSEAIPPRKTSPHRWPPTLKGAKLRAAFCREQAAKCAKKGKAKR